MRSAAQEVRGAWIAVFGPDGAGKTAAIRRVKTLLTPRYSRIELFHLRPRFRRRWSESDPVTAPHAQTPRGELTTVLKLLWWLLDCWFGYFLIIRPARLTGGLVMFDRYFPDVLVDPRRYRVPRNCLWFAGLMARLAPRPDLQIVLDVPAEVIQLRKAELSLRELERQRERYRQLVGTHADTVLVDGSPALDDVARQMSRAIVHAERGAGAPGDVSGSRKAAQLAAEVFAALPRESERRRSLRFVAIAAHGWWWFLPEKPRIDPAALGGWAPYRPFSRAGWFIVRAAYRLGLGPLVPGVTSFELPETNEINWRALGWADNRGPQLAIYVATPGPNRKAVVHLISPVSRECQMVIKVPLGSTAKTAILHEAAALEEIAADGLACAARTVVVRRESGVASQTFLSGEPGKRILERRDWEFLRSLLLSAETTMNQQAQRWQTELANEGAGHVRALALYWALEQVNDPRPLPACWVHGDFAPWNIRHLGRTTKALDWETARRGGLPLQDAFHFFHQQDFLFGSRPKLHHPDLLEFAASIGIDEAQCCRLELAYLVDRYVQLARTGEDEHAAFVLQSIVLMKSRAGMVAMSQGHFNPAAPAHTKNVAPASAAKGRGILFEAFVHQLNASGINYCLLGGYETPAAECDLDFMVDPADLPRVVPLLQQVARKAGGRLVQALQHETDACYFVLAKREGNCIAYLAPDCTGDYRTHGRLWLRARNVLARRRRFHTFYVPANRDRFAYYLLKKVLKQSISHPQLRKLRHLYALSPKECVAAVSALWPASTLSSVLRAIVQEDVAWFAGNLADLRGEVMASQEAESFAQRLHHKARESVRVLRRVLQPTGMLVAISGATQDDREQLADGLLVQLRPAFRRVLSLPAGGFAATPAAANRGNETRPGSGLLLQLLSRMLAAATIGVSLARSTFVITNNSGISLTGGTVERSHQQSESTELFAPRPNLCLQLTSDATSRALARCDPPSVVLIDTSLSREARLQQATEAVLCWLAVRLENRLPLPPGDQSGAWKKLPAVSPDAAAAMD